MLCEFGLGYGSALQSIASVIGKYLQFITTNNFYETAFCKKEFSTTNDTKHSLFTILVEYFAWVMGNYFQIARVIGPSTEFSNAHIQYTRPL